MLDFFGCRAALELAHNRIEHDPRAVGHQHAALVVNDAVVAGDFDGGAGVIQLMPPLTTPEDVLDAGLDLFVAAVKEAAK